MTTAIFAPWRSQSPVRKTWVSDYRKKDAERMIRLPRTQNAETIENVFENTVTSGAVGHLLGLMELVSFNGDSVRKLLCNAGTPLHRGNG